MAQVLIRNLKPDVLERLKARAARHNAAARVPSAAEAAAALSSCAAACASVGYDSRSALIGRLEDLV